MVVDSDIVGQRLDSALAQLYSDSSRSEWHDYIAAGFVLITGRSVKPSYRLQEGDSIDINQEAIKGQLAGVGANPPVEAPQAPPVLYIDDTVIVINKPAGMVVHGGDGVEYAGTVAACFADKIQQDGSLRAGIVHRLDKDTSGVMILGRTQAACENLKEQFRLRSVDKYYTALVWGHLKHQQARIELPLARHHSVATQMAVSPAGKMAITEYQTEAVYKDYSLLQIRLMTGRMHQIRVHMAHLGNPIVGDILYSKKPAPGGLRRQFLHASRLEIDIPDVGRKSFEAALPDELQDFLQGLEHVSI